MAVNKECLIGIVFTMSININNVKAIKYSSKTCKYSLWQSTSLVTGESSPMLKALPKNLV